MGILEFGDKEKDKIILIHGFETPYQIWEKYIEIKATAIPLALDYGSRLPKVYILCYTLCVNI